MPVAVVVGTRDMPGESASLFHFSEMLVPVSQWGTEYVLTGLFTGYGSIVHVTSSVRRSIVTMTGFPHPVVRIPSRGQTIRRRLENGVTCHVTSNKPIQVMMYHGVTYRSSENMTWVSMTLMPAVQHFTDQYTAQCPSSDQHTYFQYVTNYGIQMNHGTPNLIVTVPYTQFEVKIDNISTDSANPFLLSTFDMVAQPCGGIMKCDTAMFPIGPMTLSVR